MITDAESYAAQDAERKDAAEIRNSADHAVHTIGKQLAENGDTLSEEEKAPIQEKLDALKALLEDEDSSIEDIKSTTGELSESAQIIGQKMYEAAQAEAEAAESEGAEASESDDDVVEAEVVEEDDE